MLRQKGHKMARKRNVTLENPEDNIETEMFEEYQGLDAEDDKFYQFNTRTYYGAKTMLGDVESYDFDNFGYDD